MHMNGENKPAQENENVHRTPTNLNKKNVMLNSVALICDGAYLKYGTYEHLAG